MATGAQSSGINQLLWHPDYSPENLTSNICLLELSSPLSLDGSGDAGLTEITSVGIPTGATLVPVNTDGVILGWGRLYEAGIQMSNM